MAIALNYPHDHRTLTPLRLSAWEIWQIAAEAREQVHPGPMPMLDVARLITRSAELSVNGQALRTLWDIREGVKDDGDVPVLDVIEFDRELPSTALVSLNKDFIAHRDELARSTAAHELGHAIFDVPAWNKMAELEASIVGPVLRRHRLVLARSDVRGAPFNPAEWRANEFMGAFLAPPKLLHRQMLAVAAELHVPRVRRSDRLPLLSAKKAGPDRLQAVIDELAERFGLSACFIEVRLRKYRLIDEGAD